MNCAMIHLMKYLPLADMAGPDGHLPTGPKIPLTWQEIVLIILRTYGPLVLGLLIAVGLLVFFIRSKKKRDKEDKQ